MGNPERVLRIFIAGLAALAGLSAGCSKEKTDCEKACWSCDDEAMSSNVGCERQCAEQEGFVVPQSGSVQLACVERLVEDACDVDESAIDRCYWSSLSAKIAIPPAAETYCEKVEAGLLRCSIAPYWRQCPTSDLESAWCGLTQEQTQGWAPVGCTTEASIYTERRLSAFGDCMDKSCDQLVACLRAAGDRTAPDQKIHLVPGYGYVGLDICRDQQPKGFTNSEPCQFGDGP